MPAVTGDFPHLQTNLGRHCAANAANGKGPMKVHPSYKDALQRALELKEVMIVGDHYSEDQRVKLFLVEQYV